jgi:hypothetical protein
MPRSHVLILLALSLLTVSLFLGAAAFYFRSGFPLDDAWIHQTYARNLAQRAEWSFLPGHPSAGSTSPLWTILLSFGFRLGLSPYLWTWLLGILGLWCMGLLLESAARRWLSFYQPHLPWVGIIAILEWRMVWMAASGMETLLHALILTLIAIRLLTAAPRYLTLGLLCALATWTRPDGVLLFPFLALDALLRPTPSSGERWRRLLNLTLGFSLLFGLYLLFNLILEGHPWPNTFYAKQTEYLSWQQKSLLERLGLYGMQWLHGALLLLFPGMVWFFIHLWRRREAPLHPTSWILLAWWGAFFMIYLLRLPPYQHGRYILPLLPLSLLWGVSGLLLAGRVARRKWARIGLPAWRMSFALLLVLYLFFGANAYAQEVAFIEARMVDTARWVQVNLPPQAVIAAHDIGALGYFDTHPLVDLAGLISPQVIPFMNDEHALASYLDAQGVQYLIVLQGIYPTLEAGRKVVYRGLPWPDEEMPMVVYRWR